MQLKDRVTVLVFRSVFTESREKCSRLEQPKKSYYYLIIAKTVKHVLKPSGTF